MIYIFTGVWLKTDTVMKRPHKPRVNSLWRWCKWPALASVVLEIPSQLLLGEKVGMWDYLACVFNLLIWWFYRNVGDDDPMNKLRKKLKEKVAEIGGKLTIVPAGA